MVFLQGNTDDTNAQHLTFDTDGSGTDNSDIETIGYSAEGTDSQEDGASSQASDLELDLPDQHQPRRQLFEPGHQDLDGDEDVRPLESPTGTNTAGFSIVWDNVGKLVKRSQLSSSVKNVYAMFANTLMVKNRISFMDLEDANYERTDAVSIPLKQYLPSSDDWNMLTDRMEILVQRALVSYAPSLTERQHEVVWHIEHEKSAQSSTKSEIVSNGSSYTVQ